MCYSTKNLYPKIHSQINKNFQFTQFSKYNKLKIMTFKK